MHLVAWDKITQAKSKGGLGFKNLKHQNKAFVMKLCWGLLTKRDALWVKCLRAKYNCGEGTMPSVRKINNVSQTWAAITKVWHQFEKGVGRKICNGESTNFWLDLWTPLEQPLLDYAVDPSNINVLEDVKSYLGPDGGWMEDRWRETLPLWVRQLLSKIHPPMGTLADRFTWRPAKDGFFSVKSAYRFISNSREESSRDFWGHLWKWQIPEKVKLFMWQVGHERLVTNSLRAKRGLSNTSDCPFECQSEESIIHSLRDCERAKQVWKQVLRTNVYNSFFSGNVQEWLSWNTNHSPGKGRYRDAAWNRVFSLVCWTLWTSRCKQIFQGTKASTKELLHQCNYLLRESSVDYLLRHQIFRGNDNGESHWTPPSSETIRIDVDGSVREHHQAACGGVLRDAQGQWLMGFCRSLSPCNVTEAEIQAIKTGMEVAKQMGYDKISIFSDSMDAYNILMRDCSVDHPLREIVVKTRDMLYEEWDVQLHQTKREFIACADFMARQGHEHDNTISMVRSVPSGCMNLFLNDLRFCCRT